jgi:hypothetical protein
MKMPTVYSPRTIVAWNQIAFMESDGRRNPGIGSRVVVAIPVVVDIREISRIASIRGKQPPVVAVSFLCSS